MASTPIEYHVRRKQYQASGPTQAVFIRPFPIRVAEELVVVVKADSDGAVTVSPTDFTISDDNVGGDTGNVTLSTPAQEDDIVTLFAVTTVERRNHFEVGGLFNPANTNDDMDSQTKMVQELRRDVDRSAVLPPQALDAVDAELPEPLASSAIAWNSSADGFENILLSTLTNPTTASQSEMEAGTESELRMMSPELVAQAIASLSTAFTNLPAITPTTSDKLILQDTSDSDATKTATVNSILDLVTSATNIVTNVYNNSGSTIQKGQAVHISGFHVGTDEPSVAEADNSASASMPSHGLASADILNNSSGEVIAYGVLTDIDTSSYTEGDSLYVSASGGLTNVRPTGATDLVQKIAVVTRSHSTNGSIVVSGAGRVNDTPNTIDAVDGNFSGTVTGSNLSGTNTGDQDASGVSIADAGGLYTATDVEGALAEVKTIADSGTGDALTTDPLSQFASTTSAQLAGVISDKEGTGALVFANSPALTTPDIGTPSAGTLTNCTGLPASGVGSGTFADARVASSNVTQHIADIKPTESIIIACSDETTDLTTGTAKTTFRMPYAFTVTEVRASVSTAPVGSAINVDINYDNGGVQTSILSTLITIDGGDKTSENAGVPPQISTSSISDDNEMTIDIDQVGATTAGAGLKVYLIGTRT